MKRHLKDNLGTISSLNLHKNEFLQIMCNNPYTRKVIKTIIYSKYNLNLY